MQDDLVVVFLLEKKQKVAEEKEVEVPEPVAKQPTRVAVQAEVHRPGR